MLKKKIEVRLKEIDIYCSQNVNDFLKKILLQEKTTLIWVLSELDKMKCENCVRQCGYGVKPKAICESFEERK